jgi:hypothetical protein
MITEKGTLPIGVEYDGRLHRDFELRPQFVRDTVDVFEDPEAGRRASRNSQFFAACLFAGRLIRIGDIPKEAITPDMVLDMDQDDYNEILLAARRLESHQATFRGDASPVSKDGAGASESWV